MSIKPGDQVYIQNLNREIRKLAFRYDNVSNLILNIYHPQAETFDETIDKSKIENLSFLSLNVIFKNYKRGSIDELFQLGDKIWFGERLDINKKLEDLIHLDNEVFWRRVAECDCNDKLALLAARHAKKFYWKAFGVECRFTKLIENTFPNHFIPEQFIPLTKLVSPYITNLNIKQMTPLKDALVKKSIYNPRYIYTNYASELCHHLNIGVILAELTNLTSLSLQYGLRKCQYNYQKRFFEISYEDVDNLANGIADLKNLKSFRFIHTRLNDEKLRILTIGLVKLPSLENLDLMYCNLSDNSGKSMAYLLENNITLKCLNLKGNQIKAIGCQSIGFGLQQRHEPLEFLGLSQCPITTEGVLRIGGALKGTNHCSKLDLSFCSVGENGAMFVSEILSFHKHIISLNISGIPLSYSGGEILIANIQTCFYLIELECRSCGLTRGQESKLRILVERNLYYKHHPYLLKSSFTEKDEDDIDDLLEITRRTDIDDLYAGCEIFKPEKDIYPDSVDDMISTYVNDLPDQFLSELDNNAQGEQMKLIRANKEKKA